VCVCERESERGAQQLRSGLGDGIIEMIVPSPNSNSHGTRPRYYNHLDDLVDSDQ